MGSNVWGALVGIIAGVVVLFLIQIGTAERNERDCKTALTIAHNASESLYVVRKMGCP